MPFWPSARNTTPRACATGMPLVMFFEKNSSSTPASSGENFVEDLA